MHLIWILAKNVWLEQLRSRFYHLIWIFGGVLLYASLLVGVMAVEQELRVLMDLGLALLELMSLGAAAFVAATSILREMETKTIYLILSRPVSRGGYLLGRFLGLELSVASATGAMAVLHVGLLWLRGWSWETTYALFVIACLGKVFLLGALTVFLSLLSTSVFSALTMTFIFWVLGHFTEELKFLAQKAKGGTGLLLRAIEPVLPNLQVFNVRDWWPPEGNLSWGGPTYAAAYLALYAGACLSLAYWLFRKKEF